MCFERACFCKFISAEFQLFAIMLKYFEKMRKTKNGVEQVPSMVPRTIKNRGNPPDPVVSQTCKGTVNDIGERICAIS